MASPPPRWCLQDWGGGRDCGRGRCRHQCPGGGHGAGAGGSHRHAGGCVASGAQTAVCTLPRGGSHAPIKQRRVQSIRLPAALTSTAACPPRPAPPDVQPFAAAVQVCLQPPPPARPSAPWLLLRPTVLVSASRCAAWGWCPERRPRRQRPRRRRLLLSPRRRQRRSSQRRRRRCRETQQQRQSCCQVGGHPGGRSAVECCMPPLHAGGLLPRLCLCVPPWPPPRTWLHQGPARWMLAAPCAA